MLFILIVNLLIYQKLGITGFKLDNENGLKPVPDHKNISSINQKYLQTEK
jgi:hypothetical protein